MVVYAIPFLLSFFASIRYDIYSCKDVGKFLIWFSLYIYLILIIGFRYMVGGDSYFYMIYFNELSTDDIFNFSFDETYQPFFGLFTKITKLIYPSFISFQVVHAILLNTVLFFFLSKNTKYRFTALFLSFLLFYINFSVEILRESLAIVVFILNYKNFENNKWLKFYLGVIISILFHLSAVFLLVLPFFKVLKLNIWYVLILLILFFALNRMQDFFLIFENLDKINNKITTYSEVSFGWKSTIMFFLTRTLIPVGFLYWAKIRYKLIIKYESLICLFGLLGICSVFNTIIFTRFTNYFIFFYCIALSDVLVTLWKIKGVTLNKIKVAFVSIFIFFSYGYLSFYWPSKYYEKWIPYYFILSEKAINNDFIDRDY